MNPVDSARQWLMNLRLAKREDDEFIKRGKKIIKRYRDKRSETSQIKHYNILWSNVQTLIPALYAKTPRAQVERRYKDQDPVGRTASTILERCLQFEIDHYGDFDHATKGAILDRLLPGRGIAWVRFETKDDPDLTPEAVDFDKYDFERTCTDYVYWEDFRFGPARHWGEVPWVARRTYISEDEGVERFGEDFSKVPLVDEPSGIEDLKRGGATEGDIDQLKKAAVWEIWDKESLCVYWVAEGYDTLLDHKEDPYGLDNFWPCPAPLFATLTTDTLTPVPDYSLYQDQADEIDQLTTRIGLLIRALKVVGVYDSTQEDVKRMLNEGVDNTLIPVDKWAVFSEKGGVKGTIDWLPLDLIVSTLDTCYKARQQAVAVIYEVTGLSDIIRGNSVASETATAQQIKANYASLRLKKMQSEVALFTSELLRIKAQLMAGLYSPETLIAMSGVEGTQDAQYAQQALELLKSEPARTFRIEVASDSLVELDEQAEKTSRMEFLTAAGGFLQQALPVVQNTPELGPLMGEMLMFGVRSFKGARPIEAAFEQAVAQLSQPKPQQAPPPTPEQVQAQKDVQIANVKAQENAAKMQHDQAVAQTKSQEVIALAKDKLMFELELAKAKEFEETKRLQYKVDKDNETKLEIAGMNAAAAEKPAANIQFDANNAMGEIGDTIKQSTEQTGAILSDGLTQLASATQALAEAATEMARPKRRVGKRLPTGELEITEV